MKKGCASEVRDPTGALAIAKTSTYFPPTPKFIRHQRINSKSFAVGCRGD